MKRSFSLLLVLLAAVASFATIASAAPSKRTATAPKTTIVQVAASSKQFSTLVSLVKKAGLASALSGKGPFTVFAPTNQAFANLQKQKPELFAQVTGSRTLLRTVLTYHVLAKRVPGAAATAAARKNGTVKTVQGEQISLSYKSGKIVLNSSARVVVADVKASNGVVHAIGAVLVPPSLTAKPEPAPTKSIVEIAVGDSRFSTLVALVQQAGLASTLAGPGPFTVFAPTNDAFEKLRAAAPATYQAVVSTPALLAKVLTYHAVAGSAIRAAQATTVGQQNGTVTTVAGEPIRLSIVGGKLTLNGNSTVIVADVLATNGVIHAIDTVLVPPSIAG
jgi:transforming growth factor-beta-induced protein